ncbi:MAG: hypothetical protein ACRD47_00545 [Nitrososphaeraceae archaeon]
MNSISLLDLSKMTQKFCILMLLESSIDLFGTTVAPIEKDILMLLHASLQVTNSKEYYFQT